MIELAKKRMFNNEVLDTDAFLDMPLSAQALYFHLCMRADDDGFIGNPARIQKYIGASEDDLKLLVAKRFVLVFDDGVIVIKHWRMHNTIQKDRYKPTNYLEDLAVLGIKENKAYTLNGKKCFQNVSSLDTNRKQNVSPDIDIGLGSDIDNNIYGDFFEQCWSIYPNKKGKGKISDTKKRKLYEKVGLDQMLRCIERYKAYCEGKDMQYVMYGSTFFNSGYVDYLDENYNDPNPQKAETISEHEEEPVMTDDEWYASMVAKYGEEDA